MTEGSNLTDIHIGTAIDLWIRTHKITQSKFAQMIGKPATNAARLLKKKSMDTLLLQSISMVLKHYFFREFCKDMPYEEPEIETIVVNIGESINRRLKEIKMTQTEFASLLKIKQPDVSRILKRDSIDTEKLAVISELLGYNFFNEYIPKEKNSRPAEQNSETLLDRFEALVIENGNLKTEITRLQKLLDNAGIKY
jgi:predicted XRE-type DNA-binding protein